jgi:hypothetical protein
MLGIALLFTKLINRLFCSHLWRALVSLAVAVFFTFIVGDLNALPPNPAHTASLAGNTFYAWTAFSFALPRFLIMWFTAAFIVYTVLWIMNNFKQKRSGP